MYMLQISGQIYCLHFFQVLYILYCTLTVIQQKKKTLKRIKAALSTTLLSFTVKFLRFFYCALYQKEDDDTLRT